MRIRKRSQPLSNGQVDRKRPSRHGQCERDECDAGSDPGRDERRSPPRRSTVRLHLHEVSLRQQPEPKRDFPRATPAKSICATS